MEELLLLIKETQKLHYLQIKNKVRYYQFIGALMVNILELEVTICTFILSTEYNKVNNLFLY
jgi:hypothetical protein